jgi:thioredoxin reductase (NADPH)
LANIEKHDFVIVGAGPAGLSAAVGAESEHLDTLVLDSKGRLGGQAGTSSLIENFPSYPEGITGPNLVSRMVDQALRFNTEFLAPVRIDSVEATEEGLELREDGERYLGKAALLSCGVDYRRLRAKNLAAYLGRGVTYGSPRMKDIFKDRKMFVVGGANSAGQAAVHLSEFGGCSVNMLVRGERVEDRMSGYLVDKVSNKSNIDITTNTEITSVNGNGCLESITIRTGDEEREVDADELFILIGAVPRTGWLPKEVRRDKYGFVLAGSDLPEDVQSQFEEANGREPFKHESSMPGLFVAGDVRSGSSKRVALAVGEGMAVIPEVHQYMALGK